MTRIRLALLVVALGLGIPVAVLVWRALDGLALERAVRHQAVAERAFDEMERALSTWLAEEEARPFEHYRFYPGSPEERSPLAAPKPDFVIGAFQIDPDGSFHTPMQPRDERAARARGHWPPSPETEAAIARVTQLARETWKQEAPRALRKQAPAPGRDAGDQGEKRAKVGAQDPGTTRPLGGPLAGKAEAFAKKDLDASLEEEGVSLYGALQRLNRGADARSERKQKVTEGLIPDLALSAPRAVAPSMGFAGESDLARLERDDAPGDRLLDEVEALR